MNPHCESSFETARQKASNEQTVPEDQFCEPPKDYPESSFAMVFCTASGNGERRCSAGKLFPSAARPAFSRPWGVSATSALVVARRGESPCACTAICYWWRMQTSRPARRGTDVTRRRLIDGAVDILRRDGLAAATTGRIASAAGLKQPSFYVHFADRDEVFEAAAAEIGQRMLAKLERQYAKFDRAHVRRSLVKMYGSIVGAFLSEPELTRIFLRHRTDDGTVLGRIFSRHVQRARATIVSSLPLYGVTVAGPGVEAYVEIIVSGVLGTLEALLEGRLKDRDAAVEALAEVTARVLRPQHGKRR
jgi:AcrR family transcriptional regulator